MRLFSVTKFSRAFGVSLRLSSCPVERSESKDQTLRPGSLLTKWNDRISYDAPVPNQRYTSSLQISPTAPTYGVNLHIQPTKPQTPRPCSRSSLQCQPTENAVYRDNLSN